MREQFLDPIDGNVPAPFTLPVDPEEEKDKSPLLDALKCSKDPCCVNLLWMYFELIVLSTKLREVGPVLSTICVF